MDLLLPLPIRVSKITPAPLSNTAGSPSVFSGALRTLQRGGDRFSWNITVSQASDKEAFPMRAALRNIRTALRGQANRIWFADPSYKLRGSFPTGELLVNGNFDRGAAGWSTSNAALSVADGYARVQNTTTGGGVILNANAVPIVSGPSYVLRALLYPGNIQSWAVIGGPTAVSTSYVASGALTAPGLFIAAFQASGTTFFIGLQCVSALVADFVHFLYASLSRCALVNGGSQTGPNLNITSLYPTSTNGLLLPGDRVQIGTQLNTVVAPLNSDGFANGYLQCALPWRSSPANLAPIIIDKPMARCVLANISDGWDESPGGFADFNLQIQESLDA